MRLLLEGPAIEPLLERVRTEHGPDARIVHAERVRTGGVGGFFTREHFEVTVEVDAAADPVVPVPAALAVAGAAEPTPAAARTAAPVLSGLDALVAAAEARERGERLPSGPSDLARVPAPRPAPEGTTMTTADPEEPGRTPWVFPRVASTLRASDPAAPGPVAASGPAASPGPDAAAGPAPDAAADPVPVPVPVPHRPVSTESTAFADLLARLEHENARPLPLPADVGAATDVHDVDGPVASGPVAPEPVAPEPVAPEPVGPDRVAPEPVAPERVAPERVAPGRVASGPAASEPVAAAPAVVAPAGSAPVVTTRRRGRRAARRADATGAADRLAATGLPSHLVEQVVAGTDGDLAATVTALLPVLAGLPVPAPDLSRPGCVVLVVGEPARAASAAAALAARHRLGAEAVVDLGAPGTAPTADHVRREVARLRGGATGAVVVVGLDAVADPALDAWFAAVAGTITADCVVACVDATRKVADVAAWLAGLERLGLVVSALDVHRASATGDPAAVLGLGVPVLALDGARADGGAWAALVLPRLLDGEAVR